MKSITKCFLSVGVIFCIVWSGFSCNHFKANRALREISDLYSNEDDTIEEGYFKEYLLLGKDGYAYRLIDSTDDRTHILSKIKVKGDKARIIVIGDSIWFNIDSTKSLVSSSANAFGKDFKWESWVYYHYYRSHFSGKFNGTSFVFKEMSLMCKNITMDEDGDKPCQAFDTAFYMRKFVRCVDSLQYPRLRK